MVQPIVLPRSEHTLSRRDIDPDASKVLARLNELGYIAYLVGGSVRDLLVGRYPKDFDIGTSALPHQIKRAFRNCWIIGRRFRLAHVKFGTNIIEVATFRRNVREEDAAAQPEEGAGRPPLLIHRDNAYGTPEEDAFRRDFTINALFYSLADRSVIDYVGGLADLHARLVRSIGDPMDRFQEDPVRMLRAVVLAERLNFQLDPPIVDAIDALATHIGHSAPARLMEEFFKILRSGAAERTFQGLARSGLIEHISPEMEEGLSADFFDALGRLDAYRARFEKTPDTLTTTVLVGSLLIPLDMLDGSGRRRSVREEWYPALGRLPLPRKDIERVVLMRALLPKLRETDAPSRVQHALTHRSIFRDALTWLDIYSDWPEVVQHWQHILSQAHHAPRTPGFTPGSDRDNRQRRRRRRRRRPLQPPVV
jgi:poly(A) polymerase